MTATTQTTANMTTVPAIYLRLRDRKPHPLSPETMAKALVFFRANPESMDCYTFSDGRVLDGEAYRKKCSPTAGGRYVSSLVLIGTDGIPLNISRTRSDVAAELGEPDWFARKFPNA